MVGCRQSFDTLSSVLVDCGKASTMPVMQLFLRIFMQDADMGMLKITDLRWTAILRVCGA